MQIAHEFRRIDYDEVAALPVSSLMRWAKFFELKNKREKAAMEKSRKEAERESKANSGGRRR